MYRWILDDLLPEDLSIIEPESSSAHVSKMNVGYSLLEIGSRTGEAIFGMTLSHLRRLRSEEILSPDYLTTPYIQSDDTQTNFLSLLPGNRNDNLSLSNHRRGPTFPGKFLLPCYALFKPPLQRNVLGDRDSLPLRPPELEPFRIGCSSKNEQSDGSKYAKFHDIWTGW